MNRRRTLLLAAGGVFVALAVTTVAGTYALFSDFDAMPGNRVAAASVELGPGASGDLALSYPPLVEGVVAEGELTVDYRGTVAADVSVGLEPGAVPGLCVAGPGGWQNAPGVTVLVRIGAADEAEYCSLLDAGRVTIAEEVQPGTAVTAVITLRLTENTTAARIEAVDGLVVQAVGGFSDVVSGTLTASVDPIPVTPQEQLLIEGSSAAPLELAAALAAPAARQGVVPLDPELVPAECREAGMAFRLDQVVQLTPQDRPWAADDVRAAPAEPLLVFGTDGDDDITGSGTSDCIVGGDGADRLLGAGGDDVLVGGTGVDALDGGTGADLLLGDAGADALLGGPDVDRFDGGAERAVCDDVPGERALRCDPPVPPTAPSPALVPPAPAPGPTPTPEPTPEPDRVASAVPTATAAAETTPPVPEAAPVTSTTTPEPTPEGTA